MIYTPFFVDLSRNEEKFFEKGYTNTVHCTLYCCFVKVGAFFEHVLRQGVSCLFV